MKAQILPVDLNLWCVYDIVGKVKCLKIFYFAILCPLDRTTGEEVFKVLDSFLFQSGLLWSQCIGICTDGAASMTGIHSGVVGHVKKVEPNITATHCIIHREALVAKKWILLCPKSCHLVLK